jgi:hypothetical protein
MEKELIKALKAHFARESEIKQLKPKVHQNITDYQPNYDTLLENNASLAVNDVNVIEFARNLWVLQKLGGNIEGVITPDSMGIPHQWFLFVYGLSFYAGIALMFAGISIIELLYVGIVLFVLSIVAAIIYSRKFGPNDSPPKDAKHFCVIDLRYKLEYFYKVFYDKKTLELLDIWKYEYDNTSALNHKRQDGKYGIDQQGNFVERASDHWKHIENVGEGVN